MSHLRTIYVELCYVCKKKATVEVINNRSAGIGFYCRQHGDKALKEFNARARGA